MLTVAVAQPWPHGWTAKGDLIVVCCVCVRDGLVPAPPSDQRSDGYCPPHLAEWQEQIAAWKARRSA